MSPELTARGPAALSSAEVIAAAEAILRRGLWCGLEVCADVPAQRWEQRLVVCRTDPDAVAGVVAEWSRTEPDQDVRMIGCRRGDLRPDRTAPARLVHLARLGGA